MRARSRVPLLALVALVPAGALAHAVVVASTPAANAAVPPGDMPMELRFSSRIDPARSRVTLVAPDGARTIVPIAGGAPGVLSGHARVDAAGAWTIHWQVLSVDGHVTRGNVPFRVGASGSAK